MLQAKATHGETRRSKQRSSEYQTWLAIIARCENPNTRGWQYYGARGIKICREWRHDFAAFLAHVGRKPSPKHSIDRIDVNGNYEPGNVRWATAKEQANNRRARSIDRFTVDELLREIERRLSTEDLLKEISRRQRKHLLEKRPKILNRAMPTP